MARHGASKGSISSSRQRSPRLSEHTGVATGPRACIPARTPHTPLPHATCRSTLRRRRPQLIRPPVRIALIIVAVLVGLVALVAVVGALLPRGHVASRSASFHTSPDSLWSVITNVAEYASWRSDIKSVEMLPPKEGRLAWREVGKNGMVTYEADEMTRPARFVVRIADKNLPYGGTWTYEIAGAGQDTRLTITERGEVYNPIFRALARIVFSNTATIESYLGALGKKLGVPDMRP